MSTPFDFDPCAICIAYAMGAHMSPWPDAARVVGPSVEVLVDGVWGHWRTVESVLSDPDVISDLRIERAHATVNVWDCIDALN